jgi:hypothetical protein
MEQSVEKIIERNLLEVFNGRDADSRRAAIDELWDKDGAFIDPGGVHEGDFNGCELLRERLCRGEGSRCSP